MAVVGLVYHPQGSGNATESQQQVEISGQVPALDPAANAQPYQPNCGAPQNRDDADLCAQRQMAEAATKLTTKTNFQLYLVGGEIAVLLLAFVAAVRAAQAASRATRAWLSIGDVSFSKDEIRLKVKNRGGTPATQVVGRITITGIPGYDAPLDQFIVTDEPVPSIGIVGPDVEREMKFPVDERALANARARRITLYILFRIEYRTAFKRKGRTTEAMKCLGLPNGGFSVDVYGDHSRAT